MFLACLPDSLLLLSHRAAASALVQQWKKKFAILKVKTIAWHRKSGEEYYRVRFSQAERRMSAGPLLHKACTRLGILQQDRN